MSITVLDPGYEEGSQDFQYAQRLATLAGTTIGLISNGKEGTKRFFDALESELIDGHKVANIVRVTKHNYSAPAELAIMQQTQQWDAVVAGVGD